MSAITFAVLITRACGKRFVITSKPMKWSGWACEIITVVSVLPVFAIPSAIWAASLRSMNTSKRTASDSPLIRYEFDHAPGSLEVNGRMDRDVLVFAIGICLLRHGSQAAVERPFALSGLLRGCGVSHRRFKNPIAVCPKAARATS